MTGSTGAVTSLIDRYVAAARSGDSALVRPDFLPDARVRGSIDGQVVDRSAEEFLASIDLGGPAVALTADLVWFDVVGNAAIARLGCRDWHGVRYSDFLSLVRRDGRWRIAGKVFFAHERA